MAGVRTWKICKILSALTVVIIICVAVTKHASWRAKRQQELMGKLDPDVRAHVINQLVMIYSNIGGALEKQGHISERRDTVHQSLDDVYKLLNEINRKPNELNTGTRNSDVCPESYTPKQPSIADPTTHYGFQMEECTGVPMFYTLITLLFNFVHYSEENLERVPELLASVNNIYPNIDVIAAVPYGSKMKSSDFETTTLYSFNKIKSESDIWNYIISKVKTKYTYIGRNVVHFTAHERLERLVREIDDLKAYVVGSSVKTLQSGKWAHGCEQSTLQNYTLVYKSGYDLSMNQCLVCHNFNGPFVAKTQLFKKLPLPSGMTAISGFAVLFLTVRQGGKMSMVCPDAMSYVTDSSQQQLTERAQWRGLAKHINLEKLITVDGTVWEFDCSEAGTSCAWSRLGKGFGVNTDYKPEVGVGLSHCCLRRLINTTKTVILRCQEAGLLCELQEGTLLGAVKFNGLLPWETDSDITLHADNYTAFGKILKPIFTKELYWFETHPKYYEIRSLDWFVEVFTQPNTGSADLLKEGITPTNIYYDGVYLPAPISPGLIVRNRYGKEIYQHVQHWKQLGGTSGFGFYTAGQFLPCSKSGHHACLDQFLPDGNLQFRQNDT